MVFLITPPPPPLPAFLPSFLWYASNLLNHNWSQPLFLAIQTASVADAFQEKLSPLPCGHPVNLTHFHFVSFCHYLASFCSFLAVVLFDRRGWNNLDSNYEHFWGLVIYSLCHTTAMATFFFQVSWDQKCRSNEFFFSSCFGQFHRLEVCRACARFRNLVEQNHFQKMLGCSLSDRVCLQVVIIIISRVYMLIWTEGQFHAFLTIVVLIFLVFVLPAPKLTAHFRSWDD